MKKLFFSIVVMCIVFVTILIINPPEITYEEIETSAPSKPKSVPEEAFWVGGIDGGNFILIRKKANGNSMFSVQIYNDYTGDLEYSGTLQYSGNVTGGKSFGDPTFYQGWDGEKLHLTNGETMSTYKDDNLANGSSGR